MDFDPPSDFENLLDEFLATDLPPKLDGSIWDNTASTTSVHGMIDADLIGLGFSGSSTCLSGESGDELDSSLASLSPPNFPGSTASGSTASPSLGPAAVTAFCTLPTQARDEHDQLFDNIIDDPDSRQDAAWTLGDEICDGEVDWLLQGYLHLEPARPCHADPPWGVFHGENSSLRYVAMAKEGSPIDPTKIEAFARIDFDDGTYFVTSHSCEFGRDVRALKIAETQLQQQEERQRSRPASARSRPSLSPKPASRIERLAGSQHVGSVVSEQGGFCGLDHTLNNGDAPADLDHGKTGEASNQSASSVVNPADLHRETRFDYLAYAREQAALDGPLDEASAPVTAAHLPQEEINPLIPIHPTARDLAEEVRSHKRVSRRHVRIQWDPSHNKWMLHVKGRNGALLNSEFKRRGTSAPLEHGSKIQIGDVLMRFYLPSRIINNATSPTGSDAEDLENMDAFANGDTPPTSNTGSLSPPRGGKEKPRAQARDLPKATATQPLSHPATEGAPVPPKKRGPGRPPKDGVSSQKQKKEEAKAAREAAARAANGGKTPPPPSPRRKVEPSKTAQPADDHNKAQKKMNKRKREDEVLESIEGGESDGNNSCGPIKKGKRNNSPSPEYPDADSLTEADLTKPNATYSIMLQSILADIYPGQLSLKGCYRAIKLRYPYYVHKVTGNGWESSVRHNLSAGLNVWCTKQEKDGKGFFWKAIPGAKVVAKDDPETKKKSNQQRTAPAPARPGKGPSYPLGQPFPQHPFHPPPPNGIMPPNGQMAQFGPMPPNNQMAPAGLGMQRNLSGPHPASNFGPGSGNPVQFVSPQNPTVPQAHASLNGAFPAQHSPAPPQHPTQPNAAPTQPNTAVSAPKPQIESSLLPKNMPCNSHCLAIMHRFRLQLKSTSSNPDETEAAFASASRRVLHGHEGGEMSDMEKVILGHLQNFVKEYPNPNFQGFSKQQEQNVIEAGAEAEMEARARAQAQIREPAQSPSGAETRNSRSTAPPAQVQVQS